jgi:ABC-type transporter Mla MlaB component
MIKKQMRNRLLVNTITNSLKEVKMILESNERIEFDLSQVSEIDSAGIAFLIELKITGRIFFKNASPQIENLCQLYKITL